MVAENQGNPKALWNCFKKILHRSSVAVLPDCTNKTDLANTFCKFFSDKILKIRSTLQSSIPSSVTRPNSIKNTLSSFIPVSEESLLKILKSSPSKSCGLDPIPTSLVKECDDILITPITKIVNYSIKEGSFPNCFKMAHVTPLHKKPNLDRNSLKNYIPMSNLSFISKLIEKVVANQLNEFISHEGLLNVNQSAYKSSHSTETALLKIQNDIAFSVDSGKAVAVTLLDLSAAFDTIDHSLLYDCLHDWFGLDGTVLLWIKLYLSNRKQKIKIGDSFSEAVILPFGFPQGSVLGPLLCTLYTSPLSQVISKFNVTHHLYADDTQIYLAVDSRNFDSSMEELTECLKSVHEWIVGVKLNPEKTEFIIIGQKATRKSLAPNFPVPLLQNNISPSVEVKNLGVIFDSDNSFDNHVAKVCPACYYHLRDLRQICKFLTNETAILLANAMVSSCLDYCNSLLYGVSKSNIAKLQRVQNALCRIIFRLDKMSHVTPFLKKLHWLPIQHCIHFLARLFPIEKRSLSETAVSMARCIPTHHFTVLLRQQEYKNIPPNRNRMK